MNRIFELFQKPSYSPIVRYSVAQRLINRLTYGKNLMDKKPMEPMGEYLTPKNVHNARWHTNFYMAPILRCCIAENTHELTSLDNYI
jgi:hypothetical protein